MIRWAWDVREHIVDDALDQILKMAKLIGLFPFTKEYNFSIWYFLISLLFSTFGITKFTLICWYNIINPNRSFFNLYYTLFDLNIISVFIANIFCPLIKAQKLETIRKKLKDTESVIRKYIPLQFDLKWYELNWCCVVLVCFGFHGVYLTPPDFYFLVADFYFVISIFAILNQTRGFLLAIHVLMSKIEEIGTSPVQVELVTDVMTLLKMVSDYFGTRLFLISLANLHRNVFYMYLILLNGIYAYNSIPAMLLILTSLQFGLLVKSTTQIKNKVILTTNIYKFKNTANY